MIIQVVILLIIIVIWLQYPLLIKKDKEIDEPLYKKIFNIIKIPVIIICFIIIIYNFLNIDKLQNCINNLNTYMSIPKF